VNSIDTRGEVAHRIVRELLSRYGIEHQARLRAHEDRVSVGRRLRGRLGADRLACAGPVVDHHWLTHAFRKVLAQRTREAVAQAARRVGDDEADGTARVRLRLDRERGGHQEQRLE